MRASQQSEYQKDAKIKSKAVETESTLTKKTKLLIYRTSHNKDIAKVFFTSRELNIWKLSQIGIGV